MAGAKARIIERFTNLPHRRITGMYRALRGIDPPAGPIAQGSARHFAVPSKHTSEASRVHNAIFLACFAHNGRITSAPLQRGWRLMAAFNSYVILTAKFVESTDSRRLDINQTYALLAHSGFMEQAGTPEIQRKKCPTCLVSYPIATQEPLAKQGCPVCAINANCWRLSRQAASQSGNRAS